MIKVVGLTGGIGTGKSTAADYLKNKGFAHIDADQIGRDITADGSDILPVLDEMFGPKGAYGDGSTEVLNPDGSLDRKALASIVFIDQNKRKQLDSVMFKKIIEEIDKQIANYKSVNDQNTIGILLDAPLLFEAGLADRCDEVVVLVADEDVRIQRVCERDGVTAREVRNRINSQMSDKEKIARADSVIDNSKGLQELTYNLDGFLKKFN